MVGFTWWWRVVYLLDMNGIKSQDMWDFHVCKKEICKTFGKKRDEKSE